MAFSLKIVLSGALLLLVACRSDPIRFHTLTPIQSSAGSSSAGAEVQIESITVPPQVDRPQIVIRQGNSNLAILETEWWGASLVDELSSALEDQLSNSPLQRKVSVRLDVQRFDSLPGQYALIDVKWRLRHLGAGGKALLSCRSTLQTAAGASIDDVVVAHQNNLKRLAADIVRAAGAGMGVCPARS